MHRDRHNDMVRRYPEIAAAGGLAPLLRRELAGRTEPAPAEALDVTTAGSPYWAHVAAGGRSAEIACAVELPLYLATFWDSHVQLAGQQTPALPTLVAALRAWFVDRVPASALAHRVPDVRLEEGAPAFEAGPAAYVAHCWAALRAHLAEQAAEGRPLETALLPLVEAAAADPLVGRMRPFTSLSRFGVWRGRPGDDSLPLIDPLPGAPGRFVLCTYEGAPLAEGTAREVVALLAGHARAAGEPG